MGFIILLTFGIIFGVILGLILRKKAFGKIKPKVEEYLNEKGITIENELQNFIDSQENNIKISAVSPEYLFNYKNNEYTCVIVKYKVEGKSDWFLGIVSDAGTYTEFTKFNINYLKESYVLLQKIYKQPIKEINEKGFVYLPKMQNIYKFNIDNDENVVFNSIVDKVKIDTKIFKTDTDICIGNKAKLTVTDKRIYIFNGVGIWTIDIYNEISDYRKNDMCIEIDLSEICIFGQAGERMCTGFKFYFKNNDDFKEFEKVMDTIIK